MGLFSNRSMPRLYFGYVLAIKCGLLRTQPFSIPADSSVEADTFAQRLLASTFPPSQGWTDHSYQVMEVPADQIRIVASTH